MSIASSRSRSTTACPIAAPKLRSRLTSLASGYSPWVRRRRRQARVVSTSTTSSQSKYKRNFECQTDAEYVRREQGYRARSAFKLIQLNKKYSFLESARCCIDLCAAPGGWLQVASKYMPPNSVIVGAFLLLRTPSRQLRRLGPHQVSTWYPSSPYPASSPSPPTSPHPNAGT